MTNWIYQDLDELDLKFRVGDSVLTEFVRSHDPAAVLQELVQNEYDAGGKWLDVTFGESALVIKGNGTPIDRKGWNRLSLVLGTGRVADFNHEVEAKRNGIGSKNFGLRSLFLFGDTIFIQSGGKKSVLNIGRGAPPIPLSDPDTAKARGVVVSVPYRREAAGGLNAFTLDSEREVMESLARSIAPTLLKLSEPGHRKSLEQVAVNSERLNRRITWKQVTKQLPLALSGFRLLARRVSMTDTAREKREAIEEHEWQRLVEIPQAFADSDIPGYYRERGGRIKVGLSLRTSRGKLRPEQGNGIIYYPLGATNAYTGNAVSINAPFEMDANRSQIVDPTQSPQNDWLIDTAANMTASLLSTDWFGRFSANAYAAAGHFHESVEEEYADAVQLHLQTSECWPSRKTMGGRGKKPVFATAATVNVVSNHNLDGFLEKGECLHDAFNNHSEALNVALVSGVKTFTLNSLVRLRCAGEDTDHLDTEITDDESNYHYVHFPEIWLKIEEQVRCANVLNANCKQLTRQNRSDLKLAPTTLTATEELAQSGDLYRVPVEIADVCPVPPAQRLHPALSHSVLLGKPWTPKALTNWIRDVCDRTISGESTEQEREAVYKYVLSIDGRLPSTAKKAVVNAPVLLDTSNDWVEPKKITRRNASGARTFGPALHFPHKDYTKNTALAKALGFKDRVTSEDVVRFAELVADQRQLSEKFENALKRHSSLLTGRTVSRLRSIAFLRCDDGELRPPVDVFLNTAKLRACVGSNAPFPTGDSRKLYQRLGCCTIPTFEAITAHIEELRKNGRPPNSELLYPELVLALERQGERPDFLQDEEILWTGSRFSKPANTLIGKGRDKVFGGTLPCISGLRPQVAKSYLKLGAYTNPTDYHWAKLLTRIGENFEAEQRPLSTAVKRVVREAYVKFSGDPDLPPDLPWLLDDTGQLHTTEKSSEKTFLIDDDIGLSKAIRHSNSPIVFADVRERQTIQFYHRINVRSLTEVRQRLGEEIGDECKPPHWFRSEIYLDRLTRGAFGDALKQLAAHDFRRNPTVLNSVSSAVGQLHSISRIKFAESLSLRYRVGLTTALVPVSALWRDDVIYLTAVKSRSDLYDFLAFCIAERFPIDVDYQRRFSDTLYRLITCESIRDIRRCLERKGINWRPEYDDDEEGDDEDAENELNDLVEMNLIQNIRPSSKDTVSEQPPDQASSASVGAAEPENDKEERFEPLPPFDEVTPDLLEPTPDWSHPSSSGSGGGSGGGGWSPPSAQDKKRDEEIGRRGEEIVLKLEMERVERVGLPTDKVIWISKTNPMADYDIRSIDDDGKKLIIEVKSTSGEGGRFQWSKAEFQRALSERRRYILYRVYNASGKTPTVRAFRDPVALLRKGALRLDFESLRAEIESL